MVGVSWYEAVAYCKWLTAETGDAKRPYRLPTEAEWETRGTDDGRRRNRRYPWGDQWDKQRCNNKELGLGQTTPVGQFSPAGDSPRASPTWPATSGNGAVPVLRTRRLDWQTECSAILHGGWIAEVYGIVDDHTATRSWRKLGCNRLQRLGVGAVTETAEHHSLQRIIRLSDCIVHQSVEHPLSMYRVHGVQLF